jgi:hypothetical protein
MKMFGPKGKEVTEGLQKWDKAEIHNLYSSSYVIHHHHWQSNPFGPKPSVEDSARHVYSLMN